MSRYPITLQKGEDFDDNAVIGYDPPLRTFFLQGFEIDHEDYCEPEIWLGTRLEEFPTLEGIIQTARVHGYEVRELKATAIVAMMEEAGQRPDPSIGERLGIVE